ncbi:MAG TPA: hypothetical protein VLR29_01550 [Flavobacterium sp.]|nr:hypothetical protein [Flavobacterium sp.]
MIEELEPKFEKVMIIDDNNIDLYITKRLIIFVDIYMPVMSGFEFLDAYDKLPAALKKYCKVFIISSSIDEFDIERSRLDKNLTAFQVKPITNEFLNNIVPA